jgi:hypothetical protein
LPKPRLTSEEELVVGLLAQGSPEVEPGHLRGPDWRLVQR